MFECLKKMFGKKEDLKPVIEAPIEFVEPSSIVDLAKFKTALGWLSIYKAEQWPGYEIITEKFHNMGHTDLRWLGYILATALHETAHTMRPVTEYGGENYLRSKSYYPYVGRGYVQLTWRENYAKYGIVDTPEMALDPSMSAYIIVDGMTKGTFTGRRLDQYFNDKVNDPVGARRIVNGTDRAQLIAGYYQQIYKALNESVVTQRLG